MSFNFNPCVPNSWKTGLIKCMLYSAKLICSTDVLFNREVDRLREMFASNGYPNVYFDNILEKFVCSLREKESGENQVEDKVERRYILGIPYVGKSSRGYKKRVAKFIKGHLDIYHVAYKFSCMCDTAYNMLAKLNAI